MKLGLVPEVTKADESEENSKKTVIDGIVPLSLCRRIPLDSEQLVDSLSAST
jgi:hypothetical protein